MVETRNVRGYFFTPEVAELNSSVLQPLSEKDRVSLWDSKPTMPNFETLISRNDTLLDGFKTRIERFAAVDRLLREPEYPTLARRIDQRITRYIWWNDPELLQPQRMINRVNELVMSYPQLDDMPKDLVPEWSDGRFKYPEPPMNEFALARGVMFMEDLTEEATLKLMKEKARDWGLDPEGASWLLCVLGRVSNTLLYALI